MSDATCFDRPNVPPRARSLYAARRVRVAGELRAKLERQFVVSGVLRLMAAAPIVLSVFACSQPRGDGPKASGEAPPAAEAPAGMLTVGATAPNVQGKDASGQTIALQDRKGRPAIVYFYPKDGTPGCTKEACAFRDAFDKFNQRGVTIFGVSRDDEESHQKFRAEHNLPFPLVADPNGEAQKAYGVPNKLPGIAERVTFLVAADGRIAQVWPEVDPGVHADEVWKAIAQLK